MQPIKNVKEMLFYHTMNKKVHFNDQLFERDHYQIIEELKRVIVSCQRYSGFKIKVRGFGIVEDYSQIKDLQAKYHSTLKRARNKYNKENPYECINLNDSDVIILVVSYYLEDSAGNSEILNVMIYVPIFIDKYYMNIQGVKYSPLIQIVDGATYNLVKSNKRVNNTVIGRTIFGAIKMYNNPGFNSLSTIEGEEIDCTIYSVSIYNRIIQSCIYILAKYGLYGAMDFLELKHIHFSSDVLELPDKEEYYIFSTDSGIFISVPKLLYNEDKITQSYIGTIITTLNKFDKKAKLHEILSKEYWTFKISETYKFNNISKGFAALQQIEMLYDESSKAYVHLPEIDKQDVYHFLRWMMREYDILIAKSNHSLKGKRTRIAEYITSIYASKLASNIGRLTNTNGNVKLEDLKKIMNIDASYLINYISICGIVDDMDLPNDDDGKIGIKYSFKGPSGLSNQQAVEHNRFNKKKKNQSKGHLPIELRHIDYSHLGVLDLYSSPKSDPGLGGLLVPSAKLYDDNYLYDYQEPNKWRENYLKLLNDLNFAKNLTELNLFKEKLIHGPTKTHKVDGEMKLVENSDNFIPFLNFKDEVPIYANVLGTLIEIEEWNKGNRDKFY